MPLRTLQYLPILLFIFIDLDAEKALARISDEKQKSAAQAQWSKFKKESAGLIKKYRLQGNILEVRIATEVLLLHVRRSF